MTAYNGRVEHRLKSRQDFLRRLYESPGYRHALAQARSDEERKAVAAFVTEFVGSFADVLGPLIDRASRDPAFAAQLGQAVAERRPVVTGTVTAASGSDG